MSEDFVPTRASAIKNRNENKIEVVSFQSHKPKEKTTTAEIFTENKKEAVNSFNIKQAKHEVIKFGMSGFDPQKKQEAKIQLAVKLGAKPPRNKYKNYKELLKEKKQEQIKHQSRIEFQQLGKNCLGKSKAKGKSFDRKRRKIKGGILGVYGVVKGSTTQHNK